MMEIKDIESYLLNNGLLTTGENLADLKKIYEITTLAYVKAFLIKHDFVDHDYFWVGGVGNIISYGDYYWDFVDIKYDIDNDIPVKRFDEYIDYTQELIDLELYNSDYKLTFEGFCKGHIPYDNPARKPTSLDVG